MDANTLSRLKNLIKKNSADLPEHGLVPGIEKETASYLAEVAEKEPALEDMLGIGEEVSSNKAALAAPISSFPQSSGIPSSTDERALALLGSGIPAENVAASLGVTPSRISQLLSDPVFADKVAKLRYENLQAHNKRDATYDSIEDRLLEKMNASLGLLIKPMDILKALSVINASKRRGQSSPEQVINQQTIVTIELPSTITHKFKTDVNNQVISAGEQDLLTITPDELRTKAREQKADEDKQRGVRELPKEA